MLHKTLTLIIALGIFNLVNAKIWRINNTVGVTADFTTAQAAHDAANVGDTLHFESSPNDYGYLVITKRLVIIGLGDFLAANPTAQFAPANAKIAGIRLFRPGASNTLITGINTENITLDSVTAGATITSCYTGNISIGSSPNTVLSRNFITGGVTIGKYGNLKSTNCIINNNITNAITVTLDPGNIGNGSATITNNTISFPGSTLANVSFSNNICADGGTYTFYNSTINNNVFGSSNYTVVTGSTSNQIISGNGNLFSVSPTTNFTSFNGGNIYNNTNDANFQLKPTSPSLTNGVGGIQCGAFGGVNPYKLGGLQPATPAIYQLVVPGTVGNSMNVTISTRSNN